MHAPPYEQSFDVLQSANPLKLALCKDLEKVEVLALGEEATCATPKHAQESVKANAHRRIAMISTSKKAMKRSFALQWV